MVASLKRERYSLNDSKRPYRMEALCMPMYHLKGASLKVLDNNLHFRESYAMMIAICV